MLIAQGAHPKEIQERLGHSTIRITFDRYGHLFPGLDERLREGLEAGFRAAQEVPLPAAADVRKLRDVSDT
jgi:site-specific recombinase XerD